MPDRYFCGPTAESSPQSSAQTRHSEEDIEPVIPGNTHKEATDNDKLVYVDWEGNDDPENPQNWPTWQKVALCFEIGLLTTVVYMGSAVYTPGIDQLMSDLNANHTGAIAGMSVFVFGYGIGPMILSPLSERPALGRTSIYIATLLIFVILQVPTALVKSLPGFLILRFIAGFVSSPALATGGASIGDVIHPSHLPIGLGLWGICAYFGPFLGPLFGAAIVNVSSWRWVFWFMCILSGATCLLLTFFLPETSRGTLLYRKAQRLRALTGNPNIVAQAAYEASLTPLNEIVRETLWRPFQITFLEPMIMCVNLHLSLLYAIMYLWFESFPIVFQELHHFTVVELGVSYIGIMVGTWVGMTAYLTYIWYRFIKPTEQGAHIEAEVFLPANLVASVALPVALFVFAWTATASIHWIVPIIGTFIFGLGCSVLFQTHLSYLGLCYPKYMASVFASNDFFRSMIGGAFPLFASATYTNTATDKFPVGWGVSIMAFLSTAMVSLPLLFMWKGKKLRQRSRWTQKDEGVPEIEKKPDIV